MRQASLLAALSESFTEKFFSGPFSLWAAATLLHLQLSIATIFTIVPETIVQISDLVLRKGGPHESFSDQRRRWWRRRLGSGSSRWSIACRKHLPVNRSEALRNVNRNHFIATWREALLRWVAPTHMRPSAEEVASWASILGAVVTFLGLIQSGAWLVAVGVFFIGVSIVAIVYGWRGRRLLESAAINVEGRNLDSLNVANLRRRLNRSLVVQRAYHLAEIDDQDLIVSWQYDGFCRAEKETSIEFSIDSDSSVPFSELECFAYDLQHDSERRHKIRPLLIGNDGLSKKVAVPFQKPPRYQQPFSVVLNCRFPSCMKPGLQYYTSTLSFDQRYIHRFAVHLRFLHSRPDWLRVYECANNGRLNLVSNLSPFNEDEGTCEYIDLCEDVPGRSARVYVFHLSVPLHIDSRSLPVALQRDRRR